MKNQIDSKRLELHSTGDPMFEVRQTKALAGLDSAPKMRRKLTGHFGKVYAMVRSGVVHFASTHTHHHGIVFGSAMFSHLRSCVRMYVPPYALSCLDPIRSTGPATRRTWCPRRRTAS
jgi:hypothetical protein